VSVLTPTQQCCQLCRGENKFKWWWGPRCTRPTRSVGFV